MRAEVTIYFKWKKPWCFEAEWEDGRIPEKDQCILMREVSKHKYQFEEPTDISAIFKEFPQVRVLACEKSIVSPYREGRLAIVEFYELVEYGPNRTIVL